MCVHPNACKVINLDPRILLLGQPPLMTLTWPCTKVPKKMETNNSHPKNLEEQKNFKVTSVEVTMGVSGYRAPNNIIIILYISIINKNNFLSKMSTLKCSDDFKLFSDDFTCLSMDTL